MCEYAEYYVTTVLRESKERRDFSSRVQYKIPKYTRLRYKTIASLFHFISLKANLFTRIHSISFSITFPIKFPTTIPYHNSLPQFPTTIPYHNSPPQFPTTIPHHNSPPQFPTTIPHHNFHTFFIRTFNF
jgi:hypothetical protein